MPGLEEVVDAIRPACSARPWVAQGRCSVHPAAGAFRSDALRRRATAPSSPRRSLRTMPSGVLPAPRRCSAPFKFNGGDDSRNDSIALHRGVFGSPAFRVYFWILPIMNELLAFPENAAGPCRPGRRDAKQPAMSADPTTPAPQGATHSGPGHARHVAAGAARGAASAGCTRCIPPCSRRNARLSASPRCSTAC